MAKKRTIQVGDDEVVIIKQQAEDYISLTDMARYKNAEATGLVISHWLSTRYVVDFLGIWERVNNPVLMLRNSVILEWRRARMDLS